MYILPSKIIHDMLFSVSDSKSARLLCSGVPIEVKQAKWLPEMKTNHCSWFTPLSQTALQIPCNAHWDGYKMVDESRESTGHYSTLWKSEQKTKTQTNKNILSTGILIGKAEYVHGNTFFQLVYYLELDNDTVVLKTIITMACSLTLFLNKTYP